MDVPSQIIAASRITDRITEIVTDYRWNRISVRRRVVRAETRIMETSILITSVNGIKWRSYDIIDHPLINE